MENVPGYLYNNLMKNKEVLVFENSDQIVESAIQQWTEIADDAIRQRGMFTVALSGGSSPVKLYKKLSGTDLKWDKTHIFIVDERFVPFDHSDSNFHMINETLLRNSNIPEQNIHPVPTQKSSADEAARSYESDIISFFNLSSGGIPEFDLLMLGLGDDGHTASLFPGSAALAENDRLAVSVIPPEKSMHERITITFPVINSSRNIIFLITDSKKAEVVKDVLENENCNLPAASVRPYNGRLTFLLDQQAGALLSEGKGC